MVMVNLNPLMIFMVDWDIRTSLPGPKDVLTRTYDNVAQSTIESGVCTCAKYNTGDEIWMEIENGKHVVTLVHTMMDFG
jgi:hypothetical protein